jgi:hypothetical protein
MQSSWRHQFRTPLKVRRQRLKNKAFNNNSDHAITDDNKAQKKTELESIRKSLNDSSFDEDKSIYDNFHAGNFQMPLKPVMENASIQVSSSKIDKPKSQPKIQKHKKYLAITKDIMRSLNVAISYIEQNNGFEIQDLYIVSSTISINKMKVNNDTYHHLQPYVNKCIEVMLHGNVQHMEQFDSVLLSFSSSFSFVVDNHKCNIIALAIKGVLNHCESLVPNCMYSKVMSIKHGSEIERLLSSIDWPNLKSMALILFIHHLAKLYNVRRNDKRYVKALAKEFGNLLLKRIDDDKDNDTVTEKRLQKSFIKTIFRKRYRHGANTNIARTYHSSITEEIMMLIISHMSNDDSIFDNSPQSEVSSPEALREINESNNHIEIDNYNSSQREIIKDEDLKGHDEDSKDVVLPKDERNPNHLDINNHDDDDVIAKAKKRIDSAEMILKRIDHCCPSH